MHAGDTITDHQYVTAATDGMHITVTDVTTGHSGTIVLNSKPGPLVPAFSVQRQQRQVWSVVSDYGGVAEVNQYCGAANYGAPFCTYPWYAFNAHRECLHIRR